MRLTRSETRNDQQKCFFHILSDDNGAHLHTSPKQKCTIIEQKHPK